MVEGMLRSIEAGETFIVWDDDKPAATITITTASPSPSCGPRRRLPSRRCMPTRSRSTALTAARA